MRLTSLHLPMFLLAFVVLTLFAAALGNLSGGRKRRHFATRSTCWNSCLGVLVLDDADRLPIRRHRADRKLRITICSGFTFFNPVTPIVLDVPEVLLQPAQTHSSQTASRSSPVLTHEPSTWYLWHLGHCRRSVCCAFVRRTCACFGRLEGNFAEEL